MRLRDSSQGLPGDVFHSLVDLQAAINRFTAEHNRQPKPFVWKADADKIIAAPARVYSSFLPRGGPQSVCSFATSGHGPIGNVASSTLLQRTKRTCGTILAFRLMPESV